MDIKFSALTLAAVLALSGCASHTITPDEGAANIDVAYSQTKLAEAAVSTSDSLGQLAEIEKANAPKTKLNAPLDADSIGLGSLASVDWTGPVEALVQKLANTGQYKYRVVGHRPAIPVLVAVYAVNMPVADILRDANLQAGSKADIVVYPSKKLIELRYL